MVTHTRNTTNIYWQQRSLIKALRRNASMCLSMFCYLAPRRGAGEVLYWPCLCVCLCVCLFVNVFFFHEIHLRTITLEHLIYNWLLSNCHQWCVISLEGIPMLFDTRGGGMASTLEKLFNLAFSNFPILSFWVLDYKTIMPKLTVLTFYQCFVLTFYQCFVMSLGGTLLGYFIISWCGVRERHIVIRVG